MDARRRSPRAFFAEPASAHDDAAGDRVVQYGGHVVLLDHEDVWRVLVTDSDSYRQGKWKRRARRFLGDTLNVIDDGDAHRARRLALQPVVDRRAVERQWDTLVERAGRLTVGWRDGDVIDVRRALDSTSVAMASAVLLSADPGDRADELAAGLMSVMAALPRATPPLPGTSARRALKRVDRLVAELIADRGESDHDLVAAMERIDAAPTAIHAEARAFLLASADEPPSALAAVWFLLGREPAIEADLRRELVETLRGRPPVPGDDLPLLDAVIREALRLYPPARHIDRCPREDVTLGGSVVPAGSNVLISPAALHRDPVTFPEPTRFAPSRWSAERPSRGAYLPFGAGARTCIGEPLARAIVTIVLATTIPRWSLDPPADAPEPIPGAPRLHAVVRTA